MTTNYPAALDNTTILKNDAVNATISLTTHKTAHNNLADAIIAIETELGTNPKGSFSSVLSRLNATISKVPSSSQTIMAAADIISIAFRAHTSQTVRLFEAHNSSGTALAWWDKDGGFNAQSYSVAGSALESTHLSDSSSILKNPSPSITTPTISSPTFTGTPTAPTAAVDDNSTKVATTAYVINQGYAKAASPAFTGNPTAPTAAVGTNTTQIATTAFVVSEIISRQTSSIPPGTVMPYAASTPPSGWLTCDGSNVSKTTYADLFAVIGTLYGPGDENNFTLPDLRGRMVVGKGTHLDVDTLGKTEGVAIGSRRPKHAATYSLSTDSAGGHTHGTGSVSSAGSHSHTYTGIGSSSTAGAGGVSAATSASGSTDSQGSHSHGASIDSGGGHNHTVSGTVGTAGTTDAPAYITLKYMIKT
jgi:microcystin-dependent protein